jgi:hypothetical protein
MGTSSAVVLLSGGQDSTTCLFWAKERFDRVHAVAFDYGQRHRSELVAARDISKLAGLERELVILELGVLAQLGDSSLVRSSGELEGSGGYSDSQMPEGLRKNGGDRNGQPDAEAYRVMVDDEVKKMEDYVNYEGILGFFPAEGD